MTRTRFLEPAEVEVAEAVAFFDQQALGLGDRFEREVKTVVALIEQHPEIGSPLTKRMRKFRIRKFRYNIIYVTDGDEIVVVAVAHQKKRPNYWRARVVRNS